jgi:endonuclease/exonuclease/phosphatase family metal-dependent hydrolase
MNRFILVIIIFCFIECRKVSETFEPIEDAIIYYSDKQKNNPQPLNEIKLMSWNIRFGIGRSNWFGDACGLNTIFDKNIVDSTLNLITEKINKENPDILMVQECDVNSKRTSYTQEINFILNNTRFNYAYYGPVWQSQFIPSHGLGKMDMGIVIFSKWKLENAKRISLPLRSDQSAAEKYFYLRYCMLQAELNIEGFKSVKLFNVHSVAFSSDDTKKRQYDFIKNEFDKIKSDGGYFACGGDFNTLPSNSIKKDYCIEDMCEGEKFHDTENKHKEGSNYLDEDHGFNQLFYNYNSSLSLEKYSQNESVYFTHTTRHPNNKPDRRLDYFFTNYQWIQGTDTTYQDAIKFSDHAAISVKLKLPK